MSQAGLPGEEDAMEAIFAFIRNPSTRGYSTYGYELYIPHIIVAYIKDVERSPEHETHLYNGPRMRALSPIFYDAAWTLCRRGILRPGVRFQGAQATDDGSGGNGYTITNMGREWVEGRDPIPLEPSRLAQVFERLAIKFGPGFTQRAAEAVQCHQFGNYLACCVMCGAASESILLAVAAAKSGDEAQVLTIYRSANGRKKTIDAIIGRCSPSISEPFRSATGLLSYWRDEAAHGVVSEISEIEAHEALARLMRFAQFANDNWGILISVD